MQVWFGGARTSDAYSKSIFEARYRALGDAVLTDKKGEGLPSGVAQIHIHLPSHVAEPRADRTYVSEVQAIAMESEALAEAPR
jgi:hypothetical protein